MVEYRTVSGSSLLFSVKKHRRGGKLAVFLYVSFSCEAQGRKLIAASARGEIALHKELSLVCSVCYNQTNKRDNPIYCTHNAM